MSDTPLTPEDIHRLALAHERVEPWGYRDRERILAALRVAARQPAPEAGLREAARTALRAYDAEAVAVLRDDQDEAEEAALDTVDAMEALRAALAAPDDRPCTTCGGYHLDHGTNGRIDATCPVGPAAPDLRSSAGWLVERWDGNRTVQPDALRADIAVLRDALRNPQALSTLESRPCTTCGGYHFDRGANGRIDATCPVRAALTGDTPEAPTGDAGLDVERLAEALSMPGVFEDQPDDVDGLAADIAREYAALTGDTPEAQP